MDEEKAKEDGLTEFQGTGRTGRRNALTEEEAKQGCAGSEEEMTEKLKILEIDADKKEKEENS